LKHPLGPKHVEAGGLAPEVATEIPSFFGRRVEDLSQRIGGRDSEGQALQVMATLERGMMLARVYKNNETFNQAAAALASPSLWHRGKTRKLWRCYEFEGWENCTRA
jgi:hypothetical protein